MTAVVRELATALDVDGFTCHQVMAITRISYRNIDYWCRSGLVSPCLAHRPGSGHTRLFTLDDVAVIDTAARLVEAGFNIRAAFHLAHQLHGDGRTARIRAGDYAITIERTTP